MTYWVIWNFEVYRYYVYNTQIVGAKVYTQEGNNPD